MRWPHVDGDIRQTPWFFAVGLGACVLGAGVALVQGSGFVVPVGVVLICIGGALVVLAFSTVITWRPRHRVTKSHADRS
jgi:uncharacterized iron-regulated membrane protein